MSYSGGFPLKFRFCYVLYMIARFHERLALELWNLVTWERKACRFQISKSIYCQSNPWLWSLKRHPWFWRSRNIDLPIEAILEVGRSGHKTTNWQYQNEFFNKTLRSWLFKPFLHKIFPWVFYKIQFFRLQDWFWALQGDSNTHKSPLHHLAATANDCVW